jgi:hypothetical protein
VRSPVRVTPGGLVVRWRRIHGWALSFVSAFTAGCQEQHACGVVEAPGSVYANKSRIPPGIDMTIKDYRWNSTAQGWALYAVNDEKMAQWLEEAERQQKRRLP